MKMFEVLQGITLRKVNTRREANRLVQNALDRGQTATLFDRKAVEAKRVVFAPMTLEGFRVGDVPVESFEDWRNYCNNKVAWHGCRITLKG